MRQKLIAFVLRKINWGKLLPTVLRMIAEGKVDDALGLNAPSGLRSYPLKRAYWGAAGVKTFTGAALIFIGVGLESLCASYPAWSWSCEWARYVYYAGAVLAAIGLADGGTRAPWPAGTPKDPTVAGGAPPTTAADVYRARTEEWPRLIERLVVTEAPKP